MTAHQVPQPEFELTTPGIPAHNHDHSATLPCDGEGQQSALGTTTTELGHVTSPCGPAGAGSCGTTLSQSAALAPRVVAQWVGPWGPPTVPCPPRSQGPLGQPACERFQMCQQASFLAQQKAAGSSSCLSNGSGVRQLATEMVNGRVQSLLFSVCTPGTLFHARARGQIKPTSPFQPSGPGPPQWHPSPLVTARGRGRHWLSEPPCWTHQGTCH